MSLERRARVERHPPLVVLCDISGSMERYSRMMLHFMHAMTSDRDRVHSFLFGTRLSNITRHLRHRDIDVALERIGEQVQDWSGGTRIGATLEEFNRFWSRRVLGQGAVVLMITDGAVNVAPDEKTLLHIVQNSVDLAHALGYEMPKVAMLSGSESVMDSMPSTVLARQIVERANSGEVARAHVDGPFGFDNAVSPEAAKLKGIGGPVAGQADILAVPNIEMGNGLFKMLVYFRSALAAGVVLGAKVPIVLTSRADPPEARLAASAIAQIRANYGA